jgi:hypothetical protein
MKIESKKKVESVEGKIGFEKIQASMLGNGLEEAILKYAISTFPFSGAFENIPGLQEDDLQDLIEDLISKGIVKVGFYFEEMQDNLTIFYFLQLDEEKHLVLGLDPNETCVSISNVKGIFRLNDEQYMNLLKIPIC